MPSSPDPVALDVADEPTTNWGKIEAYYTQGSFPVSAAIKRFRMTFDTCVLTHLDMDILSAAMQVQAIDCLHVPASYKAEPCKKLTLLLPESNLTTKPDVFHFISHSSPVHVKPNNALWLYRDLFEQALEPLKGYAKYQTPNWDGHGAEAITAATLDYARNLMKVMPAVLGAPDAAPAADGTIALEWVPDHHHKLSKLFLDIGPGEEWTAYWKLHDGHFDTVTHGGFDPKTTKAILKDLFDHLSK